MSNEEDTFVLIVGGGPIGLTLALDMGMRGVPTMLVNENLVTSQTPKCNYINIRSMEHFRQLGIADEIRGSRSGRAFPLRVSYRTQFSGYELASTDRTLSPEESARSPEYPQPYLQVLLEQLLKRHAEQQASVDVRWKPPRLGANSDNSWLLMIGKSTIRWGYNSANDMRPRSLSILRMSPAPIHGTAIRRATTLGHVFHTSCWMMGVRSMTPWGLAFLSSYSAKSTRPLLKMPRRLDSFHCPSSGLKSAILNFDAI
jgi:hypothetical protein